MHYTKNDVLRMNYEIEKYDEIAELFYNEFINYNTRVINYALNLCCDEILEKVINKLDLEIMIKIFNNKNTKKLIDYRFMNIKIQLMKIITNKMFILCNDNDEITNILFSKMKKKYINDTNIYEVFKYLKKADYKNSLYMLYLYFDLNLTMSNDMFLILHEKYFDSYIKNDFYLLEYFLLDKNNHLLEFNNLKNEYSKEYVNCYKNKMDLFYYKKINIDEKYKEELKRIFISKKILNKLRGK